MNREIKFRAWTKENTMQYNVVPFQWDYVLDKMWHKCIDSNGSGLFGSGGTKATFEVGGFAFQNIMQYTGLKDKNKIDIYEGDIVKRMKRKFNFDEPEGRDIYYEEEISFIEYRSHGFWIHDENFGWEGESLWDWEDIEIIGNIYEHPNLLK